MLTTDDLKSHLLKFNYTEQFYKQYYDLKKDPKELNNFIHNLDKKALQQQGLWLPEITPRTNSGTFPEYLISNIRQNIDVTKHNRYNPLFLHKHDFFEMIYVYNGKCENTIDLNSSKQSIIMNEGDICILAPGTSHTMGVFDDDSIVINVVIRQTTFKQIFFNLLSKKSALSLFFYRIFYSDSPYKYILFHTKEDLELQRILENLILDCINRQEYFIENCEYLLKSVFCYLLRNHANNAILPNSPTVDSLYIYEILSYIQENYDTVTLQQLAHRFNYSEQYLSKLIKMYTSTTFSKIVQNIRFAKSCSMLESSNLPVKEISMLVGFNSVEYFIRHFKEIYNMTPTEYRHLKLKQNM